MKHYAPSCERNQNYILDVLRRILPETGRILEIGSGTGQHASFFANALPGIEWQPTDLLLMHESIVAWSGEGHGKVLPPKLVDLGDEAWWRGLGYFDAVVCINTIHIVAWPLCHQLFKGVAKVLQSGGIFYVYGPYRYLGKPLEPSNEDFDRWLKQRDPNSGIRQFEMVNELAKGEGLVLQGDEAMPSNNRSIWWRKGTNA